MKKILIALTLIFLPLAPLKAMELDGPKEPEMPIVEGYIQCLGTSPIYAGYDEKSFWQSKDIPPNQVGIEVLAWKNQEGKVSESIIKDFPTYIPYTVLKGLKEGQELKISINGIHYKLTAKQKKGIGFREDFEVVFKKLLEKFESTPHFFTRDKSELQENNVISINKKNSRIEHGPSGFNYENIKNQLDTVSYEEIAAYEKLMEKKEETVTVVTPKPPRKKIENNIETDNQSQRENESSTENISEELNETVKDNPQSAIPNEQQKKPEINKSTSYFWRYAGIAVAAIAIISAYCLWDKNYTSNFSAATDNFSAQSGWQDLAYSSLQKSIPKSLVKIRSLFNY